MARETTRLLTNVFTKLPCERLDLGDIDEARAFRWQRGWSSLLSKSFLVLVLPPGCRVRPLGCQGQGVPRICPDAATQTPGYHQSHPG